VIQAAQREVGRLWQENAISVAEEHMATAISQMALAHLYDHAERAADNGKVVWVACVEGELHEFPARLVADSLDLAGFQVKYLGANLPTGSLLELLGRTQPDLLALSVTMSFNLPSLYGATTQVRGRHRNLPIAIGGGACQLAPAAVQSLGADICVRDAAELVAAAEDRLGVGPR
jgi:methanogenic corrinoid protein MtbC1